MRKSLMAMLFGLVGIGIFVVWGPLRNAEAFNGEIFEIKGSGKLSHFEAPPSPGQKTFTNNISIATVAACITGQGVGCTDSRLEINPEGEGKAFIYLDTSTSWRISTNKKGEDTTTLAGLVGGDGSFMMAGTHGKSRTQFIIQGKVVFQKGTLTPLKIVNASIFGVSTLTRHFGTGKFSTVGSKVN